MNSFSKGKKDDLKEKVRVSTTPIVLAFLAERNRGTLTEITRFVYSVATRLEETSVEVKAIFRGNFNDPEGEIWSETVNDELWFWISSNFIEECSSPDDICFEVKKSLDDFKLID